MKVLLPFCLAALLLPYPALRGQVGPTPDNLGRLQLTPNPAPVPSSIESALIPEEIPRVAKPSGTALEGAEKKSKTDASTEALLARIHLREARTKAERDPQVIEELERSRQARTDPERREALKKYYQLLYTRIGKLDSSLKTVAAEREKVSLRQLEQLRIEKGEVPIPHIHDNDFKPAAR